MCLFRNIDRNKGSRIAIPRIFTYPAGPARHSVTCCAWSGQMMYSIQKKSAPLRGVGAASTHSTLVVIEHQRRLHEVSERRHLLRWEAHKRGRPRSRRKVVCGVHAMWLSLSCLRLYAEEQFKCRDVRVVSAS